MVRRISPVLAFALSLFLAGCGGQQLTPPGMPSISAIQAQMLAVNTIPGASVPDFYNVGLYLTELGCGGYFDTAVLNALNNARTQGEMSALSGAVLGALGLVGIGGAAISGAGIGTSLINSLINNSMQNSLAGGDPAATATLVQAATQKMIVAEGTPATASDALLALYDVYRQCSPTGIQQLKEQAITAAPSHLVVTMPAPPRNLRGPLSPRIHVPPIITVQ